MPKRIEYIDIARGIGILLVVLAHNDFGFISQYGHEVIYSFHMPLFFFLSGYFVKTDISFLEFFKKRFHSLLKPFLFTLFLIYFTSVSFEKMAFGTALRRIGKSLYGTGVYIDWVQLWFLPNLFVVSLYAFLFIVLVGKLNNRWLRLGILTATLAVSVPFLKSFYPFSVSLLGKDYALFGLPFSLDLVLLSGFFFILGSEMRQLTKETTFDNYFLLAGTGIGVFASNYFIDSPIDFNTRLYSSFLINTAEAIVGILFALGVLLYEMLTGESPFEGDNINTTMYRIVNESPVPPKTLAPRIPEAFDYIVAKALAKHPDARYQNAADMAHDLRHYQNLTIPPAAITPLFHPITVERRHFATDRRARNRNPVGEATVIMTPQGEDKPAPSPVDEAPSKRPFPSLQTVRKANQKRILATALILLLGFGLILLIPTKTPSTVEGSEQATRGLQTPPVSANSIPALPVEDPASTLNAPIEPPPLLPVVRLSPEPPLQPLRNEALKPVKPKSVTQAPAGIDDKPTQDIAAEATLNFAVSPWGDVYVDGKKMGASPPLNELRVSAGTHKIEIRNQGFASYKETLHLPANSTKKLKHRFE